MIQIVASIDHYELSMPDVFGEELIDLKRNNILMCGERMDMLIGQSSEEENVSEYVVAQIDTPSPKLKKLAYTHTLCFFR